MRGAFGKPLGTVARVNIGQPIVSISTTDKNKAHVPWSPNGTLNAVVIYIFR